MENHVNREVINTENISEVSFTYLFHYKCYMYMNLFLYSTTSKTR